MNIVIFIPIGLLLRASFPTVKWWELLLMGCVLSLMIEFCQLTLHKGFCEFDDVMHNTLGCVMGYGLSRLLYMCLPDTMAHMAQK